MLRTRSMKFYVFIRFFFLLSLLGSPLVLASLSLFIGDIYAYRDIRFYRENILVVGGRTKNISFDTYILAENVTVDANIIKGVVLFPELLNPTFKELRIIFNTDFLDLNLKLIIVDLRIDSRKVLDNTVIFL